MIISVIIPVFRDEKRLAECLQCLDGQSVDAQLFQIIVINNDAAPISIPVKLENLVLVDEPRPGSYNARNAGVKIADGELLAFTDSDCRPDRDWLKNALEWYREPHRTDRLCGPIEVFREEQGSEIAYLHDRHMAFRTAEVAARGGAVTANMFVPKARFLDVGLFDGSLLSGGDVDWSRRAKALGLSIEHRPSVKVLHPARGRLSELVAKRRRTSASHASDPGVSALPYIMRRLAPPLREMASLSLAGVSAMQRLELFLVIWLLRLSAATEFISLRWLGRKPRRS